MLLAVSNDMESVVQFLTVFILFVFVLAITYFTTRWVANYEKGKMVCRNIEVIETYKLTANKYVQIIRTGNKYLVIALGKDSVTMLSELNADEIKFEEPKVYPTINFKEILEKAMMHKTKK